MSNLDGKRTSLAQGFTINPAPIVRRVFTFTGLFNDRWEAPGNWNPLGLPGAEDIAVVLRPASVPEGVTLGELILSADLNLAGMLQVNYNMDYRRGTIRGGRLVIPTDGMLQINSTADHDLPGCTLTNAGRAVWAGGRIRGGGAGTHIYNLGAWDVQTGSEINADFGGNGVNFHNWSAFRKTAGANTALQSGVIFENTATVDVQTNALVFNNGGFFQDGSRFVGAGTSLMASGTFNANGIILSSNLVQSGGTLAGTNVFAGVLGWSAGNWNSPGATTIASNAVLQIQTDADHDMSQHTLTNYGTVRWSAGRIRGGGSGTYIYNLGLWDTQADLEMNADFGGNGVTFNNAGTFRKSAGTGATALTAGVTLNNNGTLEVQTGTVALNGGGGGGGSFNTAAAAALDFHSSYTLNPGARFSGPSAILTAGTLTGTWTGSLTWKSGSLGGTTVILPDGILNIAGGNDHDLPNCTLTNLGTVVWSGGRVRGGGTGTRIDNLGLWDTQTDSEINADFGGNGLIFNNAGVLRKSAGTGVTTLRSGVTLNNSGTLDAQSGSISLSGGYALTGGTLNFGLSGPTQYGRINFSDRVVLAGTVSANLKQGYVPAPGTTFDVISYLSEVGSFSATNLPGNWQVRYGATVVTLTALAAAPVPPVITVSSPAVSFGQVHLDFALVSGSASSFTLLHAGQATGPWTLDAQAVLTTNIAGRSFRFTTAPAGPIRFYRVQSP